MISGVTGAGQNVIAAIKAAAARDPETSYRAAGYTRKLKKQGGSLVGLCPFHEESDPSFNIALTNGDKPAGLWFCHGCKVGGTILDFYMRREGVHKLDRQTVGDLAAKLGISVGETGEPEQVYQYHSADGSVAFEVCRFPGKKFRQRKPDGAWNLRGVKRVLYRLPQLLAAGPDTVVYIGEGEGDADRLAAEGVVATTNSGGAGKGYDEYRETFEGLDIAGVVILPDNDEAGRKHAQKVARTLVGLVPWVKIVELPGLPKRGDVSDFLGSAEIAPWDDEEPSGTMGDLVKLAEATAEYEVGEEAEGVEVPAAVATATRIPPNLIADAICEDDSFARDAGGRLHFWHKGTYSPRANIRIAARTKGLLKAWARPDQWSSAKASEVGEYIGADCPELWQSPPLDRLNLLNGVLDVKTNELLPHSPDFLSPIQLPIKFDPKAECGAWDALAEVVLPEDCYETMYEIAALLMLPQTDFQKALLLLGEGDTGKSTLLQALRRFVGVENCVSLSLHKLEGNPFATARLVGKLANICPDLPSTHLESTSVFKAITGGDYLEAERKYAEGFDFKPYCRLLFSANHPPQSSDSSSAFFRRWLILPFDRSIPEEKRVGREVMDAKLADPQQLSGVLNRALAALPRVRKHGVGETRSMREAHDEFRQATDPVSVWLDHATIRGPEALVGKAILFNAYLADCRERGRAFLTTHAFTKALHRTHPEITQVQRTIDGRVSWCWSGIGLKAEGEE